MHMLLPLKCCHQFGEKRGKQREEPALSDRTEVKLATQRGVLGRLQRSQKEVTRISLKTGLQRRDGLTRAVMKPGP